MGAADRPRRHGVANAVAHRFLQLIMNWVRRLLWAATAAVLTLTSLHASTPKFFQAQTQSDFLRGDVENLSIDMNGQLVLGPATELVYETAAPFLWSLLAARDGSLFIGTG